MASSWVSNSKLRTLMPFSWACSYVDSTTSLKDGLLRGAFVTVICMLIHLNGKLGLVKAKDLCSSSKTFWIVECNKKY